MAPNGWRILLPNVAIPVFDSAPTLEKMPVLLILAVVSACVFVIPSVALAAVGWRILLPNVAIPVFDNNPTLEKLPVLL